ncbi:class II fructose-1,6-bisphosphate aldolase [Vagococcus sp. BWB3-3]|uniref:Class II fructose-1,6-bisphosphate aldolase n=1 Tax=Vagococcus allomyrinae TaxID=2794353 RepID=A0A940PAY6_9ENTE|nr:class II fructose-1,6-bisphosphate aldolase [Vagococcus allomyrinae]MBP1041207.1 class II fructose-1,6-bisphosphate aldolase [Vagococcus allomyrinae]
MAFVTLKDVLIKARAEHYAVGQFNINSVQWIEAILKAAQLNQSPVIVAASDRLIDFLGGFDWIVLAVKETMSRLEITVPVVLHLDHGQSVESCLAAIDAGFSSVMFDGSHESLSDNIRLTKIVTDYAKKNGVSVEAEVGTVGGNEDGLISGIQYAGLADCLRLVQETGIDALAAALGSVHGEYVGKPQLGFTEMAEIAEECRIPLVLHGASGIPEADLTKAIQLGHAKININTEANQAWFQSLKESLASAPKNHEPRLLLAPATVAISDVVSEKIRLFGSAGKA